MARGRQRPTQTYARSIGAQPLTAADKQRLGISPGAERYQLPNGEIISKRQLQKMAGGFTSLEARAKEKAARKEIGNLIKHRSGGMEYRNLRGTKDNFARSWRKNYMEGAPSSAVFADPLFNSRWNAWQAVRTGGGKPGAEARFKILREVYADLWYHDQDTDEWHYIG